MAFDWDAEMDRYYPDPQDCDEVEEIEEIVDECCICGEPVYEGCDYDIYEIPDYGTVCEYCMEKFRRRVRRRD